MLALHSVLLGLHLAIVGAASAAPVLCLWLEWRDGRGDELAGRAGRRLAGASFWLLWIGALIGVGIGALAWTPEFRAALGRLGPRLHSAGAEWIFSVVLIGIHSLWWKMAPRPRTWVRALRGLLPLLASTNLLYHFPMLFYVLEQIMSEAPAAVEKGSKAVAEAMEGAEFRRRMMSAAVVAKAAHFWLASFAGAGLLLMWFGRSIVRDADEPGADKPGDGRRAIGWGARWALVAAFLQLPVGMWLMVQLPSPAQRALMGGDSLATGLLLVGIFSSLGLMHFLASLAFGRASRQDGQSQRNSAAVAVVLGIIVILLMTAASQGVRVSRESRSRRNSNGMNSVLPSLD